MRACLRGAWLTESHATWRSRKHRETGIYPSSSNSMWRVHYPSSSNSMWRVQLKHAHARGRAIRTKAALSFGQRSINLPDNRRLLSILATTPMLTITQREAHKRNSMCVCVCCVFCLVNCFRRFFSSLSYFDRPRTALFSYRY